MASSPSKETLKRVRKLAEIAAELRQGDDFPVIRLTTIKSLCAEPQAVAGFAFFLAQRVQTKMRQEDSPERYRKLVDRAVKELKTYLTDPTDERKERLSSLYREMEAEQDDYQSIGFTMVRMLKSRDLVVVEECLKAVVKVYESAIWAYQAAKDYAERYDARYGTGLIPSCAPMVEEIAGFWRKYYEIKE
jgi:predicted ATPase